MPKTVAERRSAVDARSFTDEQVMFVLALLAYRGFDYLTPIVTRRGMLRSSIEEGLTSLAPLQERFRLVWGPATFRAPLTALDDTVMFAVEDRLLPGRVVVAIRGTNPVSAFDWVFGDFWAQRVVPWTFGDRSGVPVAAISLSTALGLTILRLMRSPSAAPGWQGRAWRLASEALSDPVRRVFTGPFRSFGDAASVVGGLTPLLRFRLRRIERLHRALPSDPSRRVTDASRIWHAAGVRRVMTQVDRLLASADDDLHLDLLRLLTGTALLRSLVTPGPDLAAFLRSRISRSDGPLEVVVTGHSKGGALAQAVAMWLADDRSTWDPDGEAVVKCFSYAGPTPGNAAFAARCDRVLGTSCLRVANRLDVVPHAWAVRTGEAGNGLFIDDIPDLYGPPVHRIASLRTLAGVVERSVGPLDYGHTRANVHLLDGQLDPDELLWTGQVAYQHLDEYVVRLGLGGIIDPGWFFQVF